MVALWLLAGAAFVGACLWLWFDPGWESMLAVLTTLAALLSLYVKGRQKPGVQVKQKVSGSGAQAFHADGNIDIAGTHANHSTNGPAIQAQSLVLSGAVTQVAGAQTIINQGLDHAAVRDVCLAVFHENFQKSRGEAQALASERAERFTDEFIQKLESDSPESLVETKNPDFQHSLFEAQKGFARTGDEDLAALLLKLLVDRSKQPQRNMMQLVLNESLETAPKLTEGALASLSILFLFKYTVNHRVLSHQALGLYLDREVKALVDRMSATETTFRHLEYAGCGNVGLGGIGAHTLEALFLRAYQALFVKGFDHAHMAAQQVEMSQPYSSYFIRCVNDPAKYQLSQINEDFFDKVMESDNVPEPDKIRLKAMFQANLMSHDEVRERVLETRPYMSSLFTNWNESSMTTFTLTSVGIAIGHANLLRTTDHVSDLSIWINE